MWLLKKKIIKKKGIEKIIEKGENKYAIDKNNH